MKKLKNKHIDSSSAKLILAISLVCTLAVIAPLMLERQIYLGALHIPRGLTAGTIATKDIYAERDIYYIDREETLALRSQAAASVQPVFHLSQDTALRVVSRHHELARMLHTGEERLIIPTFSSDLSRSLLLNLTDLDGENRELVLQLSDEYLRRILREGYIESERLEQLNNPERIDVRGLERTQPEKLVKVTASSFYTQESIDQAVHDMMDRSYVSGQLQPVIFDLVTGLIEPNILYDDVSTRMRMTEAQQKISPVIRNIEQGEIIIKKGFLITSEAVNQLHEIQQQLYNKPPVTIVSQSIFTILIFILFFISMNLLVPKTFRKNQYLYIVTLFVLFFTIYMTSAAYLFFRSGIELNIFFFPVALFSMLAVTLLGNIQIAVLIPVFLASLYGTLPGSSFFDVIFLIVIGILGILFVKNPRRRIDMIIGTGKLMLTYLFIALVYVFHRSIPVTDSLPILSAAALNALFTGITVIIFIPIFEHAFNLPTVFRLRELAETSNQVFRKMINVARGSYSHSVSVAELVESASDAIGANKLLAKVGALYHDIGKIDQPEYFIENQSGVNKHDELKPSLSVAVIKSHVKIGVEKGKQLHLPREVVDIIAQHHGSDVINYFYMEAIKASGQSERINEKDFSYHGTPPKTREAALVMLADSVEAAVRTIKQPTSPKIEKMIWSIIMQKIERKQLANCDLSMQDLEKVKNRFLVILTGRFHTRIAYPQKEKKEQHRRG